MSGREYQHLASADSGAIEAFVNRHRPSGAAGIEGAVAGRRRGGDPGARGRRGPRPARDAGPAPPGLPGGDLRSVTTATEPRERWQDKSRLWLGSVLPLVVLLGLLGLLAVAPVFEWSGRIGSVGFGAWVDRDGFFPDLPQGVSSQDTGAVRGWTLRVGGLYWGVVTVPDR